jgi:hypothetical protein
MTRRMHYTLWTVQWILALLYLFAGAMKLILPAAELTKQMALPSWFVRFIGVAELFGAAGLILPGLLGIRRELTPLAATGLVLIMIGAVAISFANMGPAQALMPFMVGCLAGFIAWKRSGIFGQNGRQQCWSLSQS